MTLEEYRSNLLPSDRRLFDEVVDIGIRKTIYALLDADVTDPVIQRVVISNWDISQEEFSNYLICAKKEIALYLLQQHLSFQGYSPDEADRYIASHMINIQLSRNHELLRLWSYPAEKEK